MTVMFSSPNLTKIYFNYRKGKFSPHLKCRAHWSQRLSVSLWICRHWNRYEIVCFCFLCAPSQPGTPVRKWFLLFVTKSTSAPSVSLRHLVLTGCLPRLWTTVIKLNWNSKLANVYLGEIIVEFHNQPLNIQFNECEDNSTLPICLLHFNCFIKLWSIVFVLINLFFSLVFK